MPRWFLRAFCLYAAIVLAVAAVLSAAAIPLTASTDRLDLALAAPVLLVIAGFFAWRFRQLSKGPS